MGDQFSLWVGREVDDCELRDYCGLSNIKPRQKECKLYTGIYDVQLYIDLGLRHAKEVDGWFVVSFWRCAVITAIRGIRKE